MIVLSKSIFLALFVSGSILFFARGALYKKLNRRFAFQKKAFELLKFVATLVFTYSGIFLITRSVNISIPISLLIGYLPTLYKRNRTQREEESRRKSWPLVIDQLSTAIASGVALHIALIEMATRGPATLQREFQAFRSTFLKSGSLTEALNNFVSSATDRGSSSHSRMAMQLKSTILIARDCGGQEIGPILRNLGIYLRNRERAFDEIAVRQNWIKNGAALASLTPWLLLLVLALHSQTIVAYNSDSGRVVLFAGLVVTALAYKWIGRISDSVSSEKG